ncbi:hypothetical protein BH11PLA2_BH11PLA2_27860 [soil metagenome]
MRVEYHRLARGDYLRARRFFEAERRGKSDLFADDIFEAGRRIEDNPLIGSRLDDVHRFVKTKKFKYILYYRHFAKSDSVMIYVVAHASRKPGYWLRRTRKP